MKRLSITDVLIWVLVISNIGIFSYLGFHMLVHSYTTVRPLEKYGAKRIDTEVVSNEEEVVNEEIRGEEPGTASFDAEESSESEDNLSEASWNETKKRIREEFAFVWTELEKEMAAQLEGLNQDEIDAKLTPLTIDEVTRRLGVKKEDVYRAIEGM